MISFVCGIRNPSARKKLLSEDLTFQDALKVAVADEVASKETLEVQNDPNQSRTQCIRWVKLGIQEIFPAVKIQ